MKNVDYIVAGGGIAGSVISLMAMMRGKHVMMFDQPQQNTSSLVAAGLYNPVTGRKMVKTWKAYRLWPAMYEFYRAAEKLTGESFFHDLPIYRPFVSREEMLYFANGEGEDAFQGFVKETKTQSYRGEIVNNPYGGLLLTQSGHLDIPTFLRSAKKVLLEREMYREEHLPISAIESHKNGVSFRDITARKFIWCGGWSHEPNPFDYLPYRPVKGEILLATGGLDNDMIYNRGVFVLPHADGLIRIGSTYDNHQLDTEITDKGKTQLLQKFEGLMNISLTVHDQWAGIRPATKDRRPFVGIHPAKETFAVLNGLGTKGVSLAPYFAGQLLQFIEYDGKIDEEANIERFKSLYLK